LAEELRDNPPSSVRFLLAGDAVGVLGPPVHTPAEAAALLAGWKCRAPTARLDDAVALAAELGGGAHLILVLTDQAPAAAPAVGRVRGGAFGSPRPNVAFVTSARTAREGGERCLFEIATLSDAPQTTPLVVEAGRPAALVHRDTLRLAPRETRRVILQLP